MKSGISLALAVLFTGLNASAARDAISQGDAMEAYQDFRMVVGIFNRYETEDGSWSARGGATRWFSGWDQAIRIAIPEASASSPARGQRLCLLAGNIGHVVNGSCKPDNGATILSPDGKMLT